jgi:DNA polymerase V
MLEIFRNKTKNLQKEISLFASPVSAGFPSPADDFMEKTLDLNTHLIKHPSATFFVRVQGNSMIKSLIRPGDILIVDRSLENADNKIVIALINGEFTVKRVKKIASKLWLVPENPDYRPLEITSEMNFEIWGIVTYVIHSAFYESG